MLDLLKSLGLWGTFYGALFGVLWTFLALMKGKDDPSRQRVINYLENDTPAQTYRRTLTGLLNWLDKHLSAREITLEIPETALNRAWSGGLLSLLLILALAYPLLSMLGQWVLFAEGRAGDAIVFARDDRDLVRYALGSAFLAYFGVLLYAQIKFTGTPRLVIQLVAAFLIIAVSSAFPIAFVVALLIAFTFLGAIPFAGEIVGIVVVTVTVGVSFVVPFAVAGAVLGIVSVALAIPFAVAILTRTESGPYAHCARFCFLRFWDWRLSAQQY